MCVSSLDPRATPALAPEHARAIDVDSVHHHHARRHRGVRRAARGVLPPQRRRVVQSLRLVSWKKRRRAKSGADGAIDLSTTPRRRSPRRPIRAPSPDGPPPFPLRRPRLVVRAGEQASTLCDWSRRRGRRPRPHQPRARRLRRRDRHSEKAASTSSTATRASPPSDAPCHRSSPTPKIEAVAVTEKILRVGGPATRRSRRRRRRTIAAAAADHQRQRRRRVRPRGVPGLFVLEQRRDFTSAMSRRTWCSTARTRRARRRWTPRNDDELDGSADAESAVAAVLDAGAARRRRRRSRGARKIPGGARRRRRGSRGQRRRRRTPSEKRWA